MNSNQDEIKSACTGNDAYRKRTQGDKIERFHFHQIRKVDGQRVSHIENSYRSNICDILEPSFEGIAFIQDTR
jgi:hypothetical protein